MNKSWKRQFAVIYAGQAFSILGSAAVQFAVIWWLTVQTESAVTLSVSTLAALLPSMLVGPFAGVWIDRYNRRTVMIAADGLIALSSVALGAAFLAAGAPPLWFIYAVLFLRGLGNAFHAPAMQAAIPMLVPVEMLTKAGGWGNLVVSLSNMLGPVLGAALMGILPVAAIMLVDVLGAAFAIVCLLFVAIPDIPQTGGELNVFSDMKQGFRAMRANKPLMAVFVPLIIMSILYMPLGSLFPLLVRTHFMGEAWHNSVVEFVFAGGLLVSSLAIGIWGGMRRRFLMASLAICLLGAATLVGGALPPGGYWPFVACCFFMGSSGTFMNVPVMAYTQETIAPEMMGKVFSLLMAAMTLAMPIGLLVAGPVSEVVGVDRWFLWSGVALIATGVLCRVLTRRYDRETMRPEAEPAGEA
ncbi:MAG TPA: MFS transporter [Clostridia bacterium]|nr:MAG: putative bacilysin exporter BacE [Firmicutes bacterium ADurb.Bin248]HOG00031.1 MFS transporter [Clostridia bacterium]HOS18654.1 MFS transporter [Clostridia bacterium]HPK14508.1 MFS transporter [Clostridia bacterium]